MKYSSKYIVLLMAIFIVSVTSCRKEEFAFVGTEPEQGLQAGSVVATLLQSVALNDGSNDNIIDQANCFTMKLPVSVIANGTEIAINTLDDLDNIEANFEESDDDNDTLEIVFPVTVIFEDFSEAMVTDSAELENLRADCPAEGQDDADIECVDIKYPIRISSFNPNSERTQSIAVANDMRLLNFLRDIEEGDLVTIDFPITLVLSDASEVVVNDLLELETTIENAKDDCDEDDDNDFDDDDCDGCTTEDLMAIWSGCTDWTVDKLIRNDVNISDNYTNLVFNFLEDGTAVANSDAEVFEGTWIANGVGNTIDMEIDIPGLNDFNATWQLNQVPLGAGASKVKLRIDKDNVLWLANTCSNGNAGTNADSVLENGSWQVSSYLNDGADETADFNGFSITFNANANVTADNGTPINGTWNIQSGGNKLVLNFGNNTPFDKLNNDWRFKEVTELQVELQYIGTGGRRDTLVLIKQ